MELVQVGEPAPAKLAAELDKAPGERAFCAMNPGGWMDAYIVLDSITSGEAKEFAGSLSVIVQDYEVPMLVVKYKKMSFDMPLFGTPPCGNVLNITVIDLRNYIVRHIRHMGLSDEVMAAIRSGMAAVEGMDEISLWAIVQNVIYPKHTPDDMLRGGTRQRFER